MQTDRGFTHDSRKGRKGFDEMNEAVLNTEGCVSSAHERSICPGPFFDLPGCFEGFV